ncbi:MAG: DUF4249 family protein [Bacteroidales bacterium]|nr:DUF4249 family protein [Bacteroidales bacterium]
MRRFIIKAMMIAAVMMPLAACENEIETIWSSDNMPRLVLNAQIMQDETEHTVRVFCSKFSRSEPMAAEVTVTLNSKAVKVTHVVIEEEEGMEGLGGEESGRYTFQAQLSPGDRLEFKAHAMGLTATAVAEVPVAVGEITKVEVSEVTVENMFDSEKEHRVQDAITFKDHKGELDYYMLIMEDVYKHLDAGGNVVDEYVHKVNMDTALDKVLNPMGAEAAELLGYDNDFNVFTDEMFADGEYTFKILASKWDYFGGNWLEFWEAFEEGDTYAIDRRYKIYTLGFDEFLYLKAISAAYNDIGFMTEPMIYPENVTGGLGFVAAISPIDWVTPGTPIPFTGEIPM